jgi:hypothetical protein
MDHWWCMKTLIIYGIHINLLLCSSLKMIYDVNEWFITCFNSLHLISSIHKFLAKLSMLFVLLLKFLHHKLVEVGKIFDDKDINISK